MSQFVSKWGVNGHAESNSNSTAFVAPGGMTQKLQRMPVKGSTLPERPYQYGDNKYTDLSWKKQ